MISRLRVRNFRSLGDVDLPLGRLTVLAGTNGSGKSNIVDALQFLADCMHVGLEAAITHRYGIGAVRRWSSGHPRNVEMSVAVNDAGTSGVYEFELTSDRVAEYRVKRESLALLVGQERHGFARVSNDWETPPSGLRPKVDPLNLALPLVAGDERFSAFAGALRGIASYSIVPDQLRPPQKYDPRRPMDRHGSNWVSVLKDTPEPDWKPELLTALERLTGDIVDLKVRPIAGYLTLQFEHRQDDEATTRSSVAEPTSATSEGKSRPRKMFESSQQSDGTLRVAGILTALLQEPRPTLVAIEEPESAVHPGALGVLADYIKEASTRSQIVLTTHSPDFLDHFEPENVRVVTRATGATSAGRMAHGQEEVVKRGLRGLGELYRHEQLELLSTHLEQEE